MKEIKVRAWNITLQRMSGPKTIKELIETAIHEEARGLKVSENYSNLIFIQYTGLKDKNGKEIYEGDILGVPPNNVWGIVGFGKHNVIEDYYMYEAYGWYTEHKGKKSGILTEDLGYCEIVGDIYENPELLKSKKEVK